MFDLEKEIKIWKKNLQKHSVFEAGFIADIELHLRETYASQRQSGSNEREAFFQAIDQLGTVESIAAEYDKNRRVKLNRHSPLRPGRFMPALLLSYIKTSFRVIKRHTGYSFINIFGLAIGMTVCLMISLWVLDEWSYDRFNTNANQIYRVYRNEIDTQQGATSVLTPPPMAAALKNDYAEINNATRFGTWQRQLVSGNNKSFNETRYMHVDPDFFKMFSFPLITGDPETVFSNPYSVILTEQTADKYFDGQDPLGKILTINSTYDVTVTGVIRNESLNSSLEFDLLSPFEILIREYLGEENRDSWGFNSFGTYVLLETSVSADSLNEKLTGYLKTYSEEDTDRLVLQALPDIHLFSSLGHDLSNRGDIKYVWIFSALAIFILLIASVNFMNLTTARSAIRAREVGLRKVVGASRSQLIRQFLGESILVALFALGISLIFLELLLPLFNTLSGKQLSSTWWNTPYLLFGFIGLALVTGIFSGSYPALFLSAFQPIRIIRGSVRSSNANPFFRKALVILQFSLSVFLIIGTLIISRQLGYMRNLDMGFNREQIVHISIHGELRNAYDSIRDRFLQNSDVLHVTAAMSLPTSIQGSPGTPIWEGQDPEAKMEIKADFVDYDYIETFEIPLVEGRSFSRTFATDPDTAFIVNEEAVRRMGLEAPVVGTKFGFWGIDGQIIGVMKDAHFQPLHQKIEPLVFKMYPDWLRRMYFKIRSENVTATLASLEKTWNEMGTDYPFEYRFLDEDFENLYRADERLGNIFMSFSVLGIFIACLGLFGLVSFIAEQRTKEIGIRKILGSSTASIVTLLNKEFLKWIGIAIIIACPLAYFTMKTWLQKFAYRSDITVGIFLLSAVLGLAVALFTVSIQTMRAARANPVDSLKHE